MATDKEILKKLRRIEIKSLGVSNQVFSGSYQSHFKGRGMSFSEVREYRFGDDIRSIDWNVTARHSAPYVKVFEEERELNVMLLIDMSGSNNFGTISMLKKDVVAEMSAVLAFSAIQNNDKVGAVLFTDKVEKFIAPGKGKSHVMRIIRDILDFSPESVATNITVPLKFITSAIKKRSIVFLFSDFDDVDANSKPNFELAIKIMAKKHDAVAVRVYDRRDVELPNVGFIELKDLEKDRSVFIDTSSKATREKYSKFYSNRVNLLEECFKRNKVASIKTATDEDYVKKLVALFSRR